MRKSGVKKISGKTKKKEVVKKVGAAPKPSEKSAAKKKRIKSVAPKVKAKKTLMKMRKTAVQILEKKDKIAPANLPPVEILPRLKANAEKLSQAGIVTVGDYLEAEVTYIARSTGETEPVIRQIKTELYAMFSAKRTGG